MIFDLFIVTIFFVIGGSLFLFIAGYFAGRIGASSGADRYQAPELVEPPITTPGEMPSDGSDKAELQEKLQRAEGAAQNLREKVEKLETELDRARAESAGLRRMTLSPGMGEDVDADEHDEALAKLDMERVAHRKTIEELKSTQAELFKIKKAGPSLPPDAKEEVPRGDTVTRVEFERLKRERDRFRKENENYRKQSLAFKHEYEKTKTEVDQLKRENAGLMDRLEKWTE